MVIDMEVEHGPVTENLELANDEETPASRRCPKINTKLLPYKCFYFLFFSAVGALFPYLAIFYKQMRLSAQKTGILIGIQPLLQLASNSVWGMIADRFGKSKMIFLIALLAWLCSNFSLSLVKYPLDIGPCIENGTQITLKGDTLRVNTKTTKRNRAELHYNTSNTRNRASNLSWTVRGEIRNKNEAPMKQSGTIVKQNRSNGNNAVYHKTMIYFGKEKMEQKFDELSALGHSPWPLDAITNFKAGTETATSHQKEDDGTFFVLLFIIVVGNLVASPVVPFADSATLQALGDDADFYGKQRQWGAIGWGISSFAVGSVASTLHEKSNCNVPSHVNYKPCFYTFAVLIMAAFVPAMFFRFEDRNGSGGMNVPETIRTLLCFDWITFLATVLFFGWSLGLLQTFLLWHLQDLGGTQFLFSIIAATQCFSEVASYRYAGVVTRMIGYHRTFYVGLVFLSLRLVFYGVIENPWLVLPIELFHGLSTTLIWSLAVSLVGLNSDVPMTMQGVLSGVYWGLGYGGGSILSGILVNTIGSTRTFIAFGIVSLVNFLILVTLRKLKFLDGPSEESRSLLETQRDEDYETIPLETRPKTTADYLP